jgi:hypothetical protein
MSISCKKVDNSLEKRILIGFITSTEFIKNISRIYNKDYFSAHSSRLIAKWCINYFKKYESAPNKHITDLFLINKKKGSIDEEDIDVIEDLLDSLSNDWEQSEATFNVALLTTQCLDLFNERKLALLYEKLEQCIDNKDIDTANKEIAEYKPLQIAVNADYINPLSYEEGIRKALEQNLDPLFKLPGELGKMMNNQLYRGGLLALQAPEKSLKSFILQELILRAVRGGINVAVFELGDMTEGDRLCRIGSYTAKLPFSREKTEDGYMTCKVPELIDADGEPLVRFNNIVYPILTAEAAIKSGKKWIRRYGKDTFRLSVHSSDSTSISDIQVILETWRDVDGWVPDFIAIDYPDIAKNERSGLDERGAVNTRWKAMRRMSQDWNALIAVVTQADAGSYGKQKQGLGNFSEDKRKYSHVTAIYSINQTIHEKSQNIIRIGPLLIREGHSDPTKHVAVVHCLDLGRPYMFSYIVDVTGFDEDKEN